MFLIGHRITITYSEVEGNLVSKISKSPDLKKNSPPRSVYGLSVCVVFSQLCGHIQLFGWLITDHSTDVAR